MCLPLDQLPTEELERDLKFYVHSRDVERDPLLKDYWQILVEEIEVILKDRANAGV